MSGDGDESHVFFCFLVLENYIKTRLVFINSLITLSFSNELVLFLGMKLMSRKIRQSFDSSSFHGSQQMLPYPNHVFF